MPSATPRFRIVRVVGLSLPIATLDTGGVVDGEGFRQGVLDLDHRLDQPQRR